MYSVGGSGSGLGSFDGGSASWTTGLGGLVDLLDLPGREAMSVSLCNQGHAFDWLCMALTVKVSCGS